MTRFATRRWRNGLIAAGLTGLLLLAWHLNELALPDSRFLTGWVLVGLIALLALFNLRKALPMLPVGDANAWLQVHLYLGAVAGVAFLLHVGAGWPQGGLDLWLAWLFAGIWVSGLVGLALTRLLPQRAPPAGQREIFERIPRQRARLAREVDDIVMASARNNRSTSIVDYHTRTLHPFFAGPRHSLAHLTGSRRHLRALLRGIQTLHRYADESDRETLDALWQRVREKDGLDQQYARQLALKLWLFVHIPLTWALLPVIAVHAVLAYAFGAGPR